MKKSLIPIISIFAMSLVSAQLSLSEILSSIDSSLILLSSIFVISFLIFNFSLSKIFKEQKSIATVISAVLSFLIIYGVNSFGWDIEGFFFDIGISEDAILTAVPLILLAGLIFLFVKLKKKKYFFYIIGGFLIALGLFIFKEVAEVLVIGVALVVFGFIIAPILKFLKISSGAGGSSGANNKSNFNMTYPLYIIGIGAILLWFFVLKDDLRLLLSGVGLIVAGIVVQFFKKKGKNPAPRTNVTSTH